jgi:hypothetical protein
MSDRLEERWAERDRRREAYETEMERRRQEHKARPLVERLRDCGTFTAADGYPSYAPPRADDAKEAADEIERLRELLGRLEWADDGRCPACQSAEVHDHNGCWLGKELGH